MRLAWSWRLLIFVAILQISSVARGGIAFDVDSDTPAMVPQLTSGFIIGFLDVTPPHVGASADSWQATMTVTPGGGATLADIVLGAVAVDPIPANDLFTFPVITTGVPPPYVVSSFSIPPASLAPRTELFRVPFTIAATAPVGGTFAFDITTGTAAPGVFLGGVSLGATFGASPEFTLTVIPEPTTLLAAALAVGAGGWAGLRRRRKLEPATVAV
jgi:hypothetical protein